MHRRHRVACRACSTRGHYSLAKVQSASEPLTTPPRPVGPRPHKRHARPAASQNNGSRRQVHPRLCQVLASANLEFQCFHSCRHHQHATTPCSTAPKHACASARLAPCLYASRLSIPLQRGANRGIACFNPGTIGAHVDRDTNQRTSGQRPSRGFTEHLHGPPPPVPSPYNCKGCQEIIRLTCSANSGPTGLCLSSPKCTVDFPVKFSWRPTSPRSCASSLRPAYSSPKSARF